MEDVFTKGMVKVVMPVPPDHGSHLDFCYLSNHNNEVLSPPYCCTALLLHINIWASYVVVYELDML